MRHHSRTKALAPPREQPEHQSKNSDEEHAGSAFVAVRCAEHRRREQRSREHGARERGQLQLQISAKDEFLAKAGGGAQQEPDGQLEASARNEKAELPSHGVEL